MIETASDILWQTQLPPVITNDNISPQTQSDIVVSHDVQSWPTTGTMSNLSGELSGSWSSDNTWVLLMIDLSQPMVWQWEVEQYLSQIAYSSVENEPQEDISSFALMTSFALPNPSPQLSITEVRIDGTDEYIELTNRWDSFIWSVSISWVKTSWLLTVTLDLWTNESIVIGDNLAMVVASWFDLLAGQWLSMTDTLARSLQLIYSGDVIDVLDLTATQVVWSDNQSASREYDTESHVWQVTPSLHDANITTWHRGNPWAVWWLTLFSSTTWSIVTWSIITWSIATGTTSTGMISSGVITTWVILTWSISTGITIAWPIQITQVYPFADCVGEHLALSFTTDYSWSLTIAGLGTSDTSKTFAVSASSGSLRYIVESMSGVLSDNVILVPNMTLTDWWESLVLTNTSGLTLDHIVYSSTQAGKASTFTTLSWDTRLFTTNQSLSILSSCSQFIQTPQIGWCRISANNEWYVTGSFAAWFTVSGSLVSPSCDSGVRSVDGSLSTSNSCALWHSFAPWSHRIVYQQYSGSSLICEDEYMFYGAIHQQTIINTVTTAIIQTWDQHSCGIATQNSSPFKFGNSINIIALLDGQEIQNSSNYQCKRWWITFSGSNMCNPWYFTLPQAVIQSLNLTISKDGHELCQTYSFINYPWLSVSSSSSVSSSTSTSSYYEDLYRKRKGKHEILATNIRQQWCTVNTQDQLWWSCIRNTWIQQQSSNDVISINTPIQSVALQRFQQHHSVMIDRIIADPPWRDSDGWELIQLARDDLQSQSGVSLLLVINNKADRVILWSGSSWLVQQMYDSFPLPNDGGCIALTDMNIIQDQICYGNYAIEDMVDLATIRITNKMRELFASSEPQIEWWWDEDDEIDLLNLDLKEQKLINKALKQEQSQEISEIWDRYRDKTSDLYETYRSITESKQHYIDILQDKLEQSRAYATRITQLYQSNKDYIKTLSDQNTQYYQEKIYIQQHYPAIYLDPVLNQATGVDMWSWLIITQLSQAPKQQTLRSTLIQVIQNFFH
jgi:hypothetical protein